MTKTATKPQAADADPGPAAVLADTRPGNERQFDRPDDTAEGLLRELADKPFLTTPEFAQRVQAFLADD